MPTPTTTAKLVALVTVGICDALQEGQIEITEAERLLFSPHVISRVKKCDPTLAEIIHLGTELDSIQDLVPHEYEPTLNRIRTLAQESLSRLSYKQEEDQVHWIDSIS